MNAAEREAMRGAWDSVRRDDAQRHLVGKLTALDALFSVMPADPYREVLFEFDSETRDWWREVTGQAPFGCPLPWDIDTSTVGELVRARRYGDEWSAYLALNRHGAISLGTAHASYERPVNGDQRQRGFRLRHLVGLAWVVTHLQARVVQRLSPQDPWELTLHLYNTEGAELGDFAEGWASPGNLWPEEVPRSLTADVGVRHELDAWPEDEEDIKTLAVGIGGNIEDAFGCGQRRFIANRGELEGDVDLRRWQL